MKFIKNFQVFFIVSLIYGVVDCEVENGKVEQETAEAILTRKNEETTNPPSGKVEEPDNIKISDEPFTQSYAKEILSQTGETRNTSSTQSSNESLVSTTTARYIPSLSPKNTNTKDQESQTEVLNFPETDQTIEKLVNDSTNQANVTEIGKIIDNSSKKTDNESGQISEVNSSPEIKPAIKEAAALAAEINLESETTGTNVKGELPITSEGRNIQQHHDQYTTTLSTIADTTTKPIAILEEGKTFNNEQYKTEENSSVLFNNSDNHSQIINAPAAPVAPDLTPQPTESKGVSSSSEVNETETKSFSGASKEFNLASTNQSNASNNAPLSTDNVSPTTHDTLSKQSNTSESPPSTSSSSSIEKTNNSSNLNPNYESTSNPKHTQMSIPAYKTTIYKELPLSSNESEDEQLKQGNDGIIIASYTDRTSVDESTWDSNDIVIKNDKSSTSRNDLILSTFTTTTVVPSKETPKNETVNHSETNMEKSSKRNVTNVQDRNTSLTSTEMPPITPNENHEDSYENPFLKFISELRKHTLLCLICVFLFVLCAVAVVSVIIGVYYLFKYSLIGLIRLCRKMRNCRRKRKRSSTVAHEGSLFMPCHDYSTYIPNPVVIRNSHHQQQRQGGGTDNDRY